jgi:hypothetical protein
MINEIIIIENNEKDMTENRNAILSALQYFISIKFLKINEK